MIPEILEAQIEIGCKELRMPGLRRHFRNLVREAEEQQMEYASFLNPTFRTLEPHGKIVSAQQGFVRISRTVLYPNIGGRISAGLSQTPRRS